MKNRISETGIYFIFTTTEKKDYVDTAIGIEQLAQILNRSKQSVIRSVKNLGKKEFVLKNKEGIKYLIVSEMEMNRKNVK